MAEFRLLSGRLKNCLMAALVLGSGVATLRAETYVVQRGESINSKLQMLQPGDTLLVHAGTYYESLRLPVDGRPDRRIVLSAYGNARPVITNVKTVFYCNKDWWHIQGLVFDQQHVAEDAVKLSGSNNILRDCEIRNGKKDGIDGSKLSQDNIIENCTIHNFVNKPGTDAHGIVVNPGARGWQIRNNHIYNCGGDCIQFYASGKTPVAQYSKNFIIADNTFYTTLGSNSENALDFKGLDGGVVTGNEMYGFANKIWVIQKGCRNITGANNRLHDSDRGIESRGEDGLTQENIILVRNVIYNIREYGIKFNGVANAQALHNTLVNIAGHSFRIEGAGVTSGVFRNNLICNSGPAAVADTLTAQVDHNGWFNSAPRDLAGAGDTAGSDPQFVDAAQFNFSLRAGSPARDAGFDLGQPFAGARPDLGAFEIGMVTPVQVHQVSGKGAGADKMK